MSGPTVLKRLLDTGTNYAEMSQKNAEKLVSEFVKAGQVRRKDTEKVVQRLVERGRERTEYLIGLVKAEVTKQLGVFAARLDDIEARVEEVAGNLGLGSRMPAKKSSSTAAPSPAAKQAAGPSGVAKVTTRKAPARKAAAKKAAAKKKAPAKKAAAKKKAPAKKAPETQ